MSPEPVLSTFTSVRNWLEVFYFGAGILLPIIAAFALRQIQLAKDQLRVTKEIARTSAKRESYRAAIEQCEALSKIVVPLDFKIDKFLEEHGVSYFEKAKFEPSEHGLRIDLAEIDDADLEKLNEIAPLLTDLINSLEVFAIYFLSGIAYEEIGFHSQGKYFVEKAEMVAKLLAVCKPGADECQHIWPLYKKWKDRIEHQRLVVEKKKIDAKLKATVIKPPIKSIGA